MNSQKTRFLALPQTAAGLRLVLLAAVLTAVPALPRAETGAGGEMPAAADAAADQDERASTAEAEVERLRASVKELQEQLTRARAEAKMLRGVLVTAEEATRAANARSAENAQRLEGERDAVATRLQAAEKQFSELRAASKQPARQAQEITDLRAKLAAAEAELASLRDGAPTGSEGTPAGAEASSGDSAPADKVYVTQAQDSLTLIARRFYGDGNLWNRIYEANRDVIANPDRLVPGVKLVIP